jgi:Fe-S-cluster-containing hydrogenase component 2
MDAIEMVDDVPVINEARCIGCALCVTGCGTDALELARRDDALTVPGSMSEMAVEVLERRGKLKEFIDLHK